jgi:hypothetical protein
VRARRPLLGRGDPGQEGFQRIHRRVRHREITRPFLKTGRGVEMTGLGVGAALI